MQSPPPSERESHTHIPPTPHLHFTHHPLLHTTPSSDESEVLPFAVPVLLSIPPTTHYTVRATTLRLVAELAGWINEHPDTLELVLSFIHTSLSMRPVASEAANAVQSVCEKCRSRMGEHFQGLVQVRPHHTLTLLPQSQPSHPHRS